MEFDNDVPDNLWYDILQTSGIFLLITQASRMEHITAPIIFLMSQRDEYRFLPQDT